MAEFSLAAPRCPKCFSSVSEEAARCPKCQFNFADLERRAQTPAPAAKPPPIKAAAKPKAAAIVPDLDQEIPFRWMAPQTPPPKHRWFSLSWPRPSLPRLSLPRAASVMVLFALVSLMGAIGWGAWALTNDPRMVLVIPELGSGNAQELRISDKSDPFPARTPSKGEAAQTVADVFNAQLRAMDASPP